MNRALIKTRFREDNPEITVRVVTDAVLDSWLLTGNLEFATAARLISKVTTFSAVVGVDNYSLTNNISKFFDVDQFPGGAVAFNNKPMTLTTRATLDLKTPGWRTYGNGTPNKYYRHNEFIYFNRPPSAASDITVDSIQMPDDFDDDAKTPFNELPHLEAYHNGLVLYLSMRAKAKEGKSEGFSTALTAYAAYIKWAKKTNQGGKLAKIQLRPFGSHPDSMYK